VDSSSFTLQLCTRVGGSVVEEYPRAGKAIEAIMRDQAQVVDADSGNSGMTI